MLRSAAVPFARAWMEADPLAPVRTIAEGSPPDLVGLLALAEDALALAAAVADHDDASCYRVAGEVLGALPHGSASASPRLVGAHLERAAA